LFQFSDRQVTPERELFFDRRQKIKTGVTVTLQPETADFLLFLAANAGNGF
jgi:hypothetical protein